MQNTKLSSTYQLIFLIYLAKKNDMVFVVHCFPFIFSLLLLLLPNNDLLQQFEDYVIELRCENGRRKGEKKVQ